MMARILDKLNETSFKNSKVNLTEDDTPISQFPLFCVLFAWKYIPNASAPTQSVTKRNAAMKQKCKEELLLWESEPVPYTRI